MTQIAEQTADVVAENVEEAIDGVIEVVEVFRNNPVALAVAGVVGLAAGGVGGYFIAKKILTKQYEQTITEEIADAKEFYAGLNKVGVDGTPLSPQDVMNQRHGATAAEAVLSYQGIDDEPEMMGTPHDEVVDERQMRKMEEARVHSVSIDAEPGPHGGTIEVVEKTEARNVFVDPTFDLEEETKFRTEDKPYIITHDEYFAAEKDYETIDLTYFEVDDTLTNEQDKPIDAELTIGEDHLVRFGSGSKDKNIVYIRNDKLGTDYAVTKSSGSYLEEVLGMPDEEPGTLKHSDQGDRRRAFRQNDG